jgi:hypothetical protein
MSKGSTSAPAWTPDEVAERCRALGARVVLKSNQYRVYPPDGGGPVFFNAFQESRGVHLPNVLRDLRRHGLDLLEAWQEEQEAQRRSVRPAPEPLARPAIDPATAARLAAKVDHPVGQTFSTTTKEAAMAAPTPRPHPTTIPTGPAIQRQLEELREMVRRQDESFLEMLAQQEARTRALEEQLADILSGEGPRAPSLSELVRRAVLAWFEAHPGMKITPQLLEMNLEGQLPEKRSKAMVAAACRDLALAGKLDGGGPRSGDGAGRGVYWLAEPAPESIADPAAEADS